MNEQQIYESINDINEIANILQSDYASMLTFIIDINFTQEQVKGWLAFLTTDNKENNPPVSSNIPTDNN